MRIDCESCPGRPAACDGCMMSVLVGADAVPHPGETPRVATVAEQRADLLVAIANLREATLVTSAEARAAQGRIVPREGGSSERFLTIVRAG